MTRIGTILTTNLSATVLALVLHQPALAEDAPAPSKSAPSAPQAQPAAKAPAPKEPAASAPAPAAPAEDSAPDAVAAFEKQRAAKLAELDERYEALRDEAAKHGFQMPAVPPWSPRRHWLSYQEMRELMLAQGVPLPPNIGAGAASDSAPPPGADGFDRIRKVLDSFGQMTPEQQQTCFAIAHWQNPGMPRWLGPDFSRHPMAPYSQAYPPHPGQPHPRMMYSQ